MGLRRLVTVLVGAWMVFAPAVASAHRLPPEVVAFFKADGPVLRVLVRVPTAMLGDARLPVINTVYLDLRTIEQRLPQVATEVIRSLDITDHGRPVAPGPASWILSPFGDDSFASYDRAVRRLAAPPIPLDRYVYWNEAYVDLHVDYAVAPDSDGLSVRVNGLRLGGDFFQTRATYVPSEGRSRTFTITGSPQRVVFEPPVTEAVGGFIRRAVRLLLSTRLLAALLLCLAISQRSASAMLRQFAAFAVPFVLMVAVISARLSAPQAGTQDLAQLIAALALVMAAIQNVTDSGAGARAMTVAIVGATSAVGLAADLHQFLPIAGSHAVLALVTFLAALLLGCVALLMLLQSLMRVPFSWRAPAWLTLAALSAVPAHVGAHVVADAATRLGGQDLDTAGPITHWAATQWPVLSLVAALLMLLVLSRLRPAFAPSVSDRRAAS